MESHKKIVASNVSLENEYDLRNVDLPNELQKFRNDLHKRMKAFSKDDVMRSTGWGYDDPEDSRLITDEDLADFVVIEENIMPKAEKIKQQTIVKTVDWNAIYEIVRTGYQHSLKFLSLEISKGLNHEYLITSILDKDCHIEMDLRIQLIKKIFNQSSSLVYRDCGELLIKAVKLNSPTILEILLKAEDAEGNPIFNINIIPDISGKTAYEHALQQLMQSKNHKEVASTKKIIQIIRKYLGFIDPLLQLQCDKQALSHLRSEITDAIELSKGILSVKYHAYDDEQMMVEGMLLNWAHDKLDFTELAKQLTYLERFSKLDKNLLPELQYIRRQLLELEIELPKANQLQAYHSCMRSDIIYADMDARWHYPELPVVLPSSTIDKMLQINDILVTHGALLPKHVKKIMGYSYLDKGKPYLQEFANAVCRLKQDQLLFNQDIFHFITEELNQLPLASYYARGVTEIIHALFQFKKQDGLSMIQYNDILKYLKAYLKIEKRENKLIYRSMQDLCYIANIFQLLISRKLFNENDYDPSFIFMTRGTIGLIFKWAQLHPWQDPGHLYHALTALQKDDLLSSRSLPVFLQKISDDVLHFNNHNLLFSESQLTTFYEHIQNYTLAEKVKTVSFLYYARLPYSMNETLCAGNVIYTPIVPTYSINITEYEKAPILTVISNPSDEMKSSSHWNWNNMTYSALHGVIRGTANVIDHHLSHSFSHFVAYGCGHMCYVTGLFALNLTDQYDQAPDQEWSDNVYQAAIKTTQQFAISVSANFVTHIGSSLEKGRYTALGRGLRGIGHLVSFGLFANAAKDDPKNLIGTIVAGIGAQKIVEHVGMKWGRR